MKQRAAVRLIALVFVSMTMTSVQAQEEDIHKAYDKILKDYVSN